MNDNRGCWLDRLLLVTLLLCCGMALSKGLADPDFWGHVQYGRDLLDEGLPRESTYTYTAEGHPWINHENLAEVLFAWGVAWAGPAGLLALKCLAGMAVLAIVLRQARRQGVGQLAAYTGAMLIAANMMLFWTLRPQLFSFLGFTLLLLLLDRSFAGWAPGSPATGRICQRLLPAVPLFAVWTNTHGGFLAGLAVMVAYLGLRAAESWLVAAGPRRWRLAAALGGVSLLAGLASLANPYGVQLHAWLLGSLGVPRPEIVEWRPPEWTVPWIPFWILAAAILAAAAGSRARRDWPQLIVVGLTLWQALEHRRHVVFLALLFGFWMLPHWDSLLRRLGVGRDPSTIGESLAGGRRKLFAGGLAAACLLLCASLAEQVRRIPVRHDSYPVDALQFIADHGLGGRLLTRMRWGQYAIAAFGRPSGRHDSQVTLAFDGRFRTCYPQEVVDRYFDFADGDETPLRHRSNNSPPPDPHRILDESPRPDLVLIDRGQQTPLQAMAEQAERGEWTLVYQDPLCQLWCRSDLCEDPAAGNYVPPAARTVDAEPLAAVTPWPALPRRRRVDPGLMAAQDPTENPRERQP